MKCPDCKESMRRIPYHEATYKCDLCWKVVAKSEMAIMTRSSIQELDNQPIGQVAPKIVEPHKQRWFAMHLGLIAPMLDVFTVNKDSGRYPEFSHMGKFENGREELFDAMMRHVEASQENPLAKDEKTGCYHLACVASNALMRLHDALLETPNQEAS